MQAVGPQRASLRKGAVNDSFDFSCEVPAWARRRFDIKPRKFILARCIRDSVQNKLEKLLSECVIILQQSVHTAALVALERETIRVIFLSAGRL